MARSRALERVFDGSGWVTPSLALVLFEEASAVALRDASLPRYMRHACNTKAITSQTATMPKQSGLACESVIFVPITTSMFKGTRNIDMIDPRADDGRYILRSVADEDIKAPTHTSIAQNESRTA